MPSLHKLIVLKRIFAELLGACMRERYHPERHYMRGPGPATLSKAMSADMRLRGGPRQAEQA
ncbi:MULTISPECIES: hypothetical protein [Aminobacter]|jgi:hypothetical protein|uniref:Uncharacterized protein n=1 Tax=Aminobacter aminovorans TaxID=83263 RepID=A0ABR6H2Y3_AMIAI|nr:MULTISPECIES: hypothetical protein [Aminobacter]MBB3704875.1 hypothetical protein [Aminobacter aminovorans]MRX34342.1 hypothetical protein [Aminobacter sp. MDW-2]QNH37373.1 hypothetical protein H5P29_21375 [Aminobacter sp. MDW-2]